MQHKCSNCHMPFTITKEVVHMALDKMAKKDWDRYDFTCPQCKKTNRVSKEQLLHAAPTWKDEDEE